MITAAAVAAFTFRLVLFWEKKPCTGPFYKTHELSSVYMWVQKSVCGCVQVCVLVSQFWSEREEENDSTKQNENWEGREYLFIANSMKWEGRQGKEGVCVCVWLRVRVSVCGSERESRPVFFYSQDFFILSLFPLFCGLNARFSVSGAHALPPSLSPSLPYNPPHITSKPKCVHACVRLGACACVCHVEHVNEDRQI